MTEILETQAQSNTGKLTWEKKNKKSFILKWTKKTKISIATLLTTIEPTNKITTILKIKATVNTK